MKAGGKFAAETTVSVEKTRAEIERLIYANGATRVMTMTDAKGAQVAFDASGRRVLFTLPLPDRESFRTITAVYSPRYRSGRTRTDDEVTKLHEQACRSKWRSMLLVLKAKFEAVASGITSFEHEFLANVVLPNNTTVGQWIAPQLAAAYASGDMPTGLQLGDGRDGSR